MELISEMEYLRIMITFVEVDCCRRLPGSRPDEGNKCLDLPSFMSSLHFQKPISLLLLQKLWPANLGGSQNCRHPDASLQSRGCSQFLTSTARPVTVTNLKHQYQSGSSIIHLIVREASFNSMSPTKWLQSVFC